MSSEDFHPEAETSNVNTMPDSDDSEEETSYEDPPVTSWSELSIIERVGLNSVKLSEKDLETAFSQISLAFRCDQYTLKQRLQSEEHARNLAEENIQLELSRGRETLETLKALCLDSRRRSILQRLELSLDILGGTVERISNTAEVLGAVHQEARVSRAVELMVAHVESLRRRHDRNLEELEKTKKILQQQEQLNSYRHKILLRTFTDAEEREKRKVFNDCALRRRISASIISSQTQERRHQDLRTRISSCSEVSKEDSCLLNDRQLGPDPPEGPDSDPPPPPNPDILSSDPSLDALRQRHKVKAASSKTMAKIHRQNSVATSGSSCKKHRLTLRVHRCRWVRTCTALLVLLCVILMIYFIWKLYDGELEP